MFDRGCKMSFTDRQKRRQDLLMPDKILEIAARDGRFSVSLRYRDDWLRARCMRLVKKKMLRKERGINRGHVVFVPVKQPASQP